MIFPFSVQSSIRRTWFLPLGFFIIGLGYFFSYIFGNPGILYLAVIFSVLMSFVSYWYSDKLVLRMTKAWSIKEKDNPEVYKNV